MEWSRNCLPFSRIWGHLRFQLGSCCSIFSFLCSVLHINVWAFVLFLVTISLSVLLRSIASDYLFGILSVLLRSTASDYLFAIFKLFFSKYRNRVEQKYIPRIIQDLIEFYIHLFWVWLSAERFYIYSGNIRFALNCYGFIDLYLHYYNSALCTYFISAGRLFIFRLSYIDRENIHKTE